MSSDYHTYDELCTICRCLLARNDPNTVRLTTPSNVNPNIFPLLGRSLVNNTSCRELYFENLELWNVNVASTLARGIANSKLERLYIRYGYRMRPIRHGLYNDDEEGQSRRTFFQGIQASTTLRDLHLACVLIDQWTDIRTLMASCPSLQLLCLAQLTLHHVAVASESQRPMQPQQQQASDYWLVRAFQRLTTTTTTPVRHSNPSLKCLRMIGRIRERFPGLLEKFLISVHQSMPCLSELTLDSIPADQVESWVRFIVRTTPTIRTLSLFGFKMLPQQLTVVPCLQNLIYLTTLNLNDGVLDGDSMLRLAHFLRGSDDQTSGPFLTTLKLSRIQYIDDDKFVALMDNSNNLGSSRYSIQHLSLHDNDIGPDGVDRLMRFITTDQDYPTLQSLNLSSNAIGHEGLLRIGNALPHLPPQFTHLDLRDNITKFVQQRHRRQQQPSMLLQEQHHHPLLDNLGNNSNIMFNDPDIDRARLDRFRLSLRTRIQQHHQWPPHPLPVVDEQQQRQQQEQDAALERQAGMALLHGIEHNPYIQQMEVNSYDQDNNDLVLCDPHTRHQFDFYVALNRMGRRYLFCTKNGAATSNNGEAHDPQQADGYFPSTLWCHVFAKSSSLYPDYAASIVYFFLSEQPTLMMTQPTLMIVPSLQMLVPTLSR